MTAPVTPIRSANVTQRSNTAAQAPRVRTWTYDDPETGRPLFRVVRRELSNGEKQYAQQRPDGDAWQWGLDGITRPLPLYREAELREAVARGIDTVHVAEGEKCADTLRAAALVATTNAGGAGKWESAHAAKLAGFSHVVIHADNDAPGRTHAEQVAASVARHAASVKIVTYDDLPPKGDVADWLEDHDTAELLRRVEATAPWWLPVERSGSEQVRVLSWQDVEQMPPPTWDVDGIIPTGAIVEVFAGLSQFKTFLLLDLALRRAHGMDWNGRQMRSGRTFYIYTEGIASLRVRVSAWLRYHRRQHPRDLFYIPHPVPLNTEGITAELVEEMRRAATLFPDEDFNAPPWIVVDTRTSCFAGDENSAADMGGFVRALQEIRNATGATIIVLHHPGWSNDDRSRGSYAWNAACDTIIKVERDENRVTVSCEKQRDAERFSPLTFERVEVLGEHELPGSLVFEPVAAGAALTERQRECLRLLLGAPEDGWTYGTWSRAAGENGTPETTFRRYRTELRDRRFVELNGNKYRITEAGRLAVALPAQRAEGECQ